MAFDEEDIYQEHILDHYEDPFHRGQLDHPTHRHEDDNPLCGDVIAVELVIDDDGTIRQAYFDGDGCCISQASASMLMERFDGKTIDEVKQFSAEDMLQLFGAKLTPNRQKCCLLSWKVLQSAIYSPADGSPDDGQPLRDSTGPSLAEES
ncbi:MAG: iron-sulfur cluster assembly scaffold protein [Planctomycetota bacterium]|nr:iron-sulfur cluster assembly scaffold protein [Planctomycetota bacterium]